MENIAKQVMSPKAKTLDLHDGLLERKWQSGGVAYENIYITSAVSPSPIKPVSSKLIDLIEKENVPSRYFISENAMQGILRRVDKLGRNLFPPLDNTLRKITITEPVGDEDVPLTTENELKLDKIG
ncbi:hypothetical protein [Escherichia coli]